MAPAKDKTKTKTKVLGQKSCALKCLFCLSELDNEDILGKKLTKGTQTVHYFCLLFASGLSQRGKKETEGLLGFLPKDINRELYRARRLKCIFCSQHSATIGCVVSKCRKTFHFTCGLKHDVLNQYFGNFRSYCEEHRPIQTLSPANRLTFHGNTNATCCICLNAVDARPSISTIQAPCCKRAWFHKTCIQRTATNAGLHFFKCPLCCNKEEFQDEMLNLGIYIPDQDASWEREPNAFEELLHRHNRCDAQKCLTHKGRKYNKDGSKWEIMLCDCCGSSGTHLHCAGKEKASDDWICRECKEITAAAEAETKAEPPTATTSSGNQSQNLSQPKKRGRKRKSEVVVEETKRLKTESLINKIIFANTQIPKPPKTPVIRTRHAWHPDDSPQSHYSMRMRSTNCEDASAGASTSEPKITPTKGASRIRNALVPITPIPLGKLICMKLLPDKQKTFEILSMSSPRKSLCTATPREQPPIAAVIRSLLPQYESPSSQETLIDSEVGSSSEGSEEAVVYCDTRQSVQDSVSIFSIPESESEECSTLVDSSIVDLCAPSDVSTCGSTVDYCDLDVVNLDTSDPTFDSNELNSFEPISTPASVHHTNSCTTSKSNSSLGTGICTHNSSIASTSKPAVNEAFEALIKRIRKRSNGISSNVVVHESHEDFLAHATSKTTPAKPDTNDGSVTRTRSRNNSVTSTAKAVVNEVHEDVFASALSKTNAIAGSATRMRSCNNSMAGTSDGEINLAYEDFLASLDGSQGKGGTPALKTPAEDARLTTRLLRSRSNTPVKSSTSQSQSNSSTPLRTSRSNTPVKSVSSQSQSRSNTPVGTSKTSVIQSYNDFLASVEKKLRANGQSGTKTPSSSVKDKMCQTYEDFLSSMGMNEVQRSVLGKLSNRHKSSGRRKSRKKLPMPQRRSMRGSSTSTTNSQDDTISLHGSSSYDTDGSDVGYINCNEDGEGPVFCAKENVFPSSTGPVQYKDCSSDSLSVCSSRKAATSDQDSISDSPYLDCNGDNCVSEEVINLLGNNNPEDMEEYTKHFSKECIDDEVVFSSVSAKRYRLSRKYKTQELTTH